jgi:hypothetical protein
VIFGYRVLSWTSFIALYDRVSRFGRLNKCFQGSHFVSFVVISGFGLKIGFYRRCIEASWSAREL